MNEFALQITNGCKKSDIDKEYTEAFENLEKIDAIKEDKDGLFRLSSLYRIGELYISKDGTGFVESILKSEMDMLIEPENLKNSKRGDLVVAKRIIAKRGRASGKIILTAKKAYLFDLAYINID